MLMGRKVVKHRIGEGFAEGAVAVAESDPDTIFTEANNVGKSAVGQVWEESRMPVDAPVLRITVVGDADLWPLKGPIPVADGGPDIFFAESDDVSTTISVQINHETWVPIDPPASSLVTKVGNHDLRILKTPVTITKGRPNSAIPKTDNVGKTAAGQWGKESWMLV